MEKFNKKAWEGLAQFVLVLGICIFLPAWSLRYWQGWLFYGVFTVSIVLITAYLQKNDPELLRRRSAGGPGAEKEKKQKTIQTFMSLVFIGMLLFPGFDHRLKWSPEVPVYAVIGANVLVALGLLIIFFTFRENTYTSATIEVDKGQTVTSTGPYAIVRHPMYAGALVLLLALPPALGSWWGMLFFVPFVAGIIWRLTDEENYLVKNLNGYAAYREKVRFRLVPFLY